MRSLLLAVLAVVPLAAQTLPRRQLVEEVRLDATAEDFPDVTWVAVNSRGEMAVFVSKDQQFRFYDAAGTRLGIFGRVGSGPGEFRRVQSIGWVGDTLWVYDSDQRRITYVGPDRKLIRTELMSSRLNAMPIYTPGSAATMRPPSGPPGDGTISTFNIRAVSPARYIGVAMVAEGRLPDGRQDYKLKIMTVTRDKPAARGTATLTPAGDTVGEGARAFIADDPFSSATNRMNWSRADGRGSASMVVPYTFSPASSYSVDGARIGFLSVEPAGVGGTYTLKVISSSGEKIFSRSYPYTGVPIPRSVADSVLENLGMMNGRSIFQPEALQQFKGEARTRMPKFYSPVGSLHMNRDNTAWIQLRRPNPQSVAGAILVDERGNPVASIEVPVRARIVSATRDQIWAVVTDEDDLPSVVRYRLK